MQTAAARQSASPWWVGYFDDVFFRVYRALLTQERTAVQVDAIGELLADRPGARILDVGCGWGRHAIELARAGFRVTGLDLSAYLLARARESAAAAGVEVNLIETDMRAIPFRRDFDVALSLFSSLGYFLSDEQDLRVLRGIREAVIPGGLLLIETMHRDLIAREFVERDWWETPDGDTVWVERTFDPVEGVSHESLGWRAADGSEGEKAHAIRVRCASEWNVLLRTAGWVPVDWFGNWELEPFEHRSERLLVLARVDSS